ncbi:MAG: caspase family protein [Planctomycetota bacterium]|nr:caspase family protein [Planctomycetota bacterium]
MRRLVTASVLALALGLVVAHLPAPSVARAQDAARLLELDLDPARTTVFAVGVLTYRDRRLASFPQEGRRDAELVAHLRARGATDVVFLTDREATLRRIERDFEAHLERSQPGQTLVVYYTGHGLRDDGEVGFTPWDAGRGLGTTWRVRAIVDAIRARFRGERALMLIDCCHSGAMTDAVAALGADGPLAWTSLASAHAAAQSTGNWTFTEAVLEGLRGDPRIDADEDGLVDLGEVATFAEVEMAFAEEQLTQAYAHPRFGPTTRLARVSAPRPPPRVGERVEVFSEDAWWKARVLEMRGERAKVRYYGWGPEHDEWVEPRQMRAYAPRPWPVGARVEVESDGRWFPASIIEVRPLGLHKVHYDDYDASWDEWVPSSRIREPGARPDDRRRRRRPR